MQTQNYSITITVYTTCIILFCCYTTIVIEHGIVIVNIGNKNHSIIDV